MLYRNLKTVDGMSNKIYPIGIQNFEKIRKDGYFYIDKTAWVYQLAKTGSYYFLSRPRRFGKSLLISTLEAYFRGKKELFKGLAIEKLEKDWTEHPILHLDLNIERYDTPESLGNILEKNLSEWEKLYGADVSERTYSLRFAGIIKRQSFETFQTYLVVCVLYFILTFTVTRLLRFVERKLDGNDSYVIFGSQSDSAAEIRIKTAREG